MRNRYRVLAAGLLLLSVAAPVFPAPVGIDLMLETTAEDFSGDTEIILEQGFTYFFGNTGFGVGATAVLPVWPDAAVDGADFRQEYHTVVPGIGLAVGNSVYLPVEDQELEAMIYASAEHSQGPIGIALEAEALYYPDFELLVIPTLSGEIEFTASVLYLEFAPEILLYDEQLVEEASAALGYEIYLRGTSIAFELEQVYIAEFSEFQWNATVSLERTF
jgi:hypothetical protein